MKLCTYCQSPLLSSITENSTSSTLFCCRSCELVWNMSQGVQLLHFKNDQLETEAYSYLANPEIEKKFQRHLNQRHFKFHIEGLQCVSCVHLLEELPRLIPGVFVARIDMSESTLYVELNDQIELPMLCAQIVELGYKPRLLQSDDQLQNIQKIENREDLKKLAIAGAVAGNIMLFTVPLYGGLDGHLAFVFKWISFFLFLPLVFYSSQNFYHNALQSLKKRMINVDVTIVIALWMGFTLSTWNLINNKDELYFDSTASFIFLILCSRFYMKKMQQKFLVKNILSHLFQKELYTVEGSEKKITADLILQGQLIQIKQGQMIPCDGELISDSIELDLAYLTGESWPEKIDKKNSVFAGAKLLSSSAVVKAAALSKQSHLGQLVQKIDSLSSTSDIYKTETDQAAHWLTFIVLSLAALFFVLYFQTNPWMAFQRSLALLIVACPCAIAFGTPLALSLGIKKAYKKGFFIRSESFFERLLSVKKVVLDKTGTLTESKLELVRVFPQSLDTKLMKMILLAESQSRHPVALSLRQDWSDLVKNESSEIEVIDIKNIPGVGVEATYKVNQNIEILTVKKAQNGESSTGLIEVVVSLNHSAKAYLFFEEKIREKTFDFVQKLYDQKFEVFILTGDVKSRALEFAKKFKIPAFRVFSEQSPEMKEEKIRLENPCLYVGDGLNDLLALKSAQVSYAIEGQFDVTLSVADVYAPQKGPEGVLQLLELSRRIQHVVRSNLFFALIYNLIAGALALSGAMSPLLAAVIMPISSTFVLSHTLWRLK